MPPARKASSTLKSAGRKPTLSPTRISTYLECAVKYRYIYIDKIGRFFLKSRAYFSFGSTLHHVLQGYHEGGAEASPADLEQNLEQAWIGAGYTSPEQEKQHQELGKEIVASYHTAHQERIAAQVETIANEKTITCDLGRFKLSGRIDRLDRHPDGRLEIIDYKSGRQETTPEEVEQSLAMNCYQLILARLYPDTPITATIYCLRSGIQASYSMGVERQLEFERDLILLGNEILDFDYPNAKPVRMEVCADCDFLSRCERWWASETADTPLDGPFSEDGI